MGYWLRGLGATLLVSAVAVVMGCGDHSSDRGGVDFNADVRPILSDNCFRCHGPDSGSRKAGLRLDVPEGAYGELPESPGKHAVVPGNVANSELVRRISSQDPDERMPPVSSHKTLLPEQIKTLTAWVAKGAKYSPHWAYVPPRRLEPPKSRFASKADSAIDQFIYARLDKSKLTPSAEADRETLINRVTLDLTGLPPTLAEVDHFLGDKGAGAYERVVDRLLASPRYGERMASVWMDLARYSESDGYLDDLHGRLFWPWRDWVIQALNKNMPYDQFVTWQLAGDLLPNSTKEQLLATAFGRLGKRSTENGIIDEEYRVDYMNERAELVGKAFLGLTVGCAKCHDHKYDTISQEDYYSLGAFFNSIDERGFYAAGYSGRTVGPTLLWTDAGTDNRLAQIKDDVQRAEAKSSEAWAKSSRKLAGEARRMSSSPKDLEGLIRRSLQGATVAYYPLDGMRPMAAGEIDTLVKIEQKSFLPADSPLLKAIAQSTTKLSSPKSPIPRGRIPNGLVEDQLRASPAGDPSTPPAVLQEAEFKPGKKGQAFCVTDHSLGFLPKKIGLYERNQAFSFSLWMRLPKDKVYDDAMVVNNRDHNVLSGDSGYTLNLEKNHLRFDLIHMSPHNMLSVKMKDVLPEDQWVHVLVTYDGSSLANGVHLFVNGEETPLEVRTNNLTRTVLPTMMAGTLGGGYYGFTFGYRFREEVFSGGLIDELHIYGRDLTALEARMAFAGRVVLPQEAARADQDVLSELLAQDAPVQKANKELAIQRGRLNDLLSSQPEIMVMGDTPTPRQAFLLERGVYSQHGKPVSPRGLERVFKWASGMEPNRLGLSKWLFDPANPLTSRVLVNRLWEMHFGRGLVETVDDFGTQGAVPTHPELLDWLATELIQSGWDLKHMHRLMVLSATYRQSSNASKEQLEIDPRNQLLARASRLRLPAETIRDNALAASGLLVGAIGGPSVHPYQPAGVWESVGSRHGYPDTTEVTADENHRRSLYTFIKRTAEAPSMVVFDFADRNVSTVKRSVSNTPLQALVLLNDPQYREAYRAFATRVISDGGNDESQVRKLVRLALRRQPEADELSVLIEYLVAERRRFEMTPGSAQKALRIGSEIERKDADVNLAAMTSVAAAIMNTPDAYSIR